MIHEVLDAWGREGLMTHVKKMQTEYKQRAAIVQEAAGMLPHMGSAARVCSTKIII